MPMESDTVTNQHRSGFLNIFTAYSSVPLPWGVAQAAIANDAAKDKMVPSTISRASAVQLKTDQLSVEGFLKRCGICHIVFC